MIKVGLSSAVSANYVEWQGKIEEDLERTVRTYAALILANGIICQ